MALDVLMILAAGALDRMRGGASEYVAHRLGIPKDPLRYLSFFGFGAVLYWLSVSPASPQYSAAPLLFGLGMWLSGKILGWSGVYGQMLGITTKRERWQVGPLRNPVLATIFVNLVWGGGGCLLLGVAYSVGLVPAGAVAPSVAVPVALAIAGVAAPYVARKVVPVERWYTGEGFFFSAWGVMEFCRGLLAGLLCALSS